ncbi:Hypothetical predicted protein [Marmota monax]|uniref:Uncharacterized protein n=1 Tax=Marmota monax TaxID=9995 RepID=A0A5E4CUC2_MARMO|nr:Hypothetical predicted protein [Marmota monax]
MSPCRSSQNQLREKPWKQGEVEFPDGPYGDAGRGPLSYRDRPQRRRRPRPRGYRTCTHTLSFFQAADLVQLLSPGELEPGPTVGALPAPWPVSGKVLERVGAGRAPSGQGSPPGTPEIPDLPPRPGEETRDSKCTPEVLPAQVTVTLRSPTRWAGQCAALHRASDGSRGSVGLTINTPDPPTVHLNGHTATVTQPGSLVLLGPNNTSSSISWKLLSRAAFSSTNQKLKLQFTPNSAVVTLGPYPAVLKKQEEQLRASLSGFLKRRFLPLHNAQLRGHSLPLPNVKGLSFNQAHMDLSEDYLLLTIPE